jgi:glucosamine kinase
VAFYLGIDGGGTKTACVLGDEARTLATATAGPSNIVRVGEAQARESLHKVVREVCAMAGITSGQVARTCIGAAGAATPHIDAVLHHALAEILPAPVIVLGDMEIALEAAFGDGPGVIVIAGTGSIAFGRDPLGRTLRAGGWGFAISDEGSAHWIGRTAVSAVLRAADRAGSDPGARRSLETSAFVTTLLKAWGLSSIPDLVRAGNAIPAPDFAALFASVAPGEDALSERVLKQAGAELAHLAADVAVLFGDEVEHVPVAMVGGVFRHSPLVREYFYNELHQLDPRVEMNPKLVEPVEGALRIARKGSATM